MLCSTAMDEAMDDKKLIGYEIYELPWNFVRRLPR